LFEAGQQAVQAVSFKKAWEDYLVDVVARKGPDSNAYRSAEQTGRINIIPVIKNKDISNITDQDWQNLISNAKPTQKNKEALSRKTLSNIKNEIMLFCKYAKKARLIDHKPDDIEIPAKAEYVGKKILQPSQLEMFLSDSDTNDDFQYIHAWQLMAVTGMRPGECYGLKESDVEDSIIDIKRSINARNVITNGKNKNALRVIYQPEIAKTIILLQHEKKKRMGVISPWLFPKADGDAPNPCCSYNEWYDYRMLHRLDGISLYSMRHTYMSYMDRKHDMKRLKGTVGHSESMNTQSYIHEIDGDKLIAKESADEIFSLFLKVK
jgi:integrase